MTLTQVLNWLTPVLLAWAGLTLRGWKAAATAELQATNRRIDEVEKSRATDRLDLGNRIDNIEEDLEDLRRDTVTKEEWIRETTRFRQSLERNSETLARIEGRLDIGQRVATAIDRLAEQKAEK